MKTLKQFIIESLDNNTNLSDNMDMNEATKEDFHKAFVPTVKTHEDFKDHTKNPYHKILTNHGFSHVSTEHKHNSLAPNNPKGDYTEHKYTKSNSHGSNPHVVNVWQHHYVKPKDKPTTWTLYYRQHNGITAPSQGDTKPQMDKALTHLSGKY